MKTLLLLATFLVPLGMAACADDATTTYHNAVTGDECTPNPTFEGRSAHHAKHPGCDDSGCWGSDGTRYNAIGGALVRPDGRACQNLGGVMSCP